MQVYDKAASAVLDNLWEDWDFRAFFHTRGYELVDLGSLVSAVFVPAYLAVKRSLTGGQLEMLEAQVTEDVLAPLHNRPSFREAWDQWDQATRDQFLREQSEMQLGLQLVSAYRPALSKAYQDAFLKHLQGE